MLALKRSQPSKHSTIAAFVSNQGINSINAATPHSFPLKVVACSNISELVPAYMPDWSHPECA